LSHDANFKNETPPSRASRRFQQLQSPESFKFTKETGQIRAETTGGSESREKEESLLEMRFAAWAGRPPV
jgi:hypothetical protein